MNEAPLYKRLSLTKHGFLDASAGTGKTYTLENFIARLITESGVNVNQILVMTFTEKAAAEIKARVRSRLYSDYQEAKSHDCARAELLMNSWLAGDQMNIFTIHGFCQSVSSEFAFENQSAMDLEMVEDASVYAKSIQFVLETELPELFGNLLQPLLNKIEFNNEYEENILKVLNNTNADIKYFPEPTETQLSDFIPRLKDTLTNSELDDSSLADHFKVVLIRRILELSKQYKTQRGLQSFNDMIAKVYEVIESESNNLLANTLANRYRYVLVDEFQDTDEMQWTILQKAFMSDYAWKNGNRIYLVGDPKQAIYRFRGGDLCTFLKVREYFQKNNQRCSYEPMNCNYRSSRELNEALNHFFRSGCKKPWFRTDKKVKQTEIAGHEIYQEDEINYVDVETGTKTSWLEQQDRQNSVQLINILETEIKNRKPRAAKYKPRKFVKAYFEQIAIEITKLINNSPQYLDRDGNTLKLCAKDICCLVRTKNESIYLESFLRQRNIPCTIYKKENLFESLEALYVEQFLLLASNPQDTAIRKKFMLSPVFRINYGDAEKLDDTQLDSNFEQCILRWNKSFKARLWGQMFAAMLNDTGLLKKRDNEPAMVSGIQQICESLHREALSQNMDGLSLIEFLRSLRSGHRKVSKEMNTYAIASESPQVQILTMHTSKGLEFPVVFFAGGFTSASNKDKHFMAHLVNDNNTVSRCVSVNKDLKEAQKREDDLELRRLYYVAFTRASLRLVLPTFIQESDKSTYEAYSRLTLEKNIISTMRQNWLKDKPSSHSDSNDCVLPGLSVCVLDSTVASRKSDIQCVPQEIAKDSLTLREGKLSDHSTAIIDLQSYSRLIEKHDDKGRQWNVAEFVESTEKEKDRDEIIEPFAELKGGADIGNVCHDSIEELLLLNKSKSKPVNVEYLSSDAMQQLVLKHCQRYGVNDDQLHQLIEIIKLTLSTSIDIPGAPSLNFLQMPANDYQPEMEFTMLSESRDQLNLKSEGFMRGAIDLVFKWHNKYYILDWKSNFIATGYDQPSLHEKMKSSKYYLQARIYRIAFLQWAETFLPQFDRKRDFGGVIYHFMRGISKNQGVAVLHADELDVPESLAVSSELTDILKNPLEFNFWKSELTNETL